MSEDVVSVVVPVYNTGLYLERCLNSLIQQTYRNLEIICVNDGSTDDSATILDEYAAKDSRVKMILQENAGVAAARNRGLEAATGEYVSFVDSDDWLEPETYEKVVAQFSDGVDIVAMGTVLDGGGDRLMGTEEYFNRLPVGKVEIVPSDFAELNITLPTKVYRRSAIERNSIRFAEGIAYGEDNAFVCCVLACARGMYNIQTRCYHYVQRENSAVHGSGRSMRIGSDLLAAWEYVIERYLHWGVLERFRPVCGRLYAELCEVLMEVGYTPVMQKKLWQLAKLSGVWAHCHHVSVHKMRMQTMSSWEKFFHWYRDNCEIYGIAGQSILSITYTSDGVVYRFLGCIFYTRKCNG